MRFVAGNRAIRDHVSDGKDLHLFEQVPNGYVRYVGQMVCTGWHFSEGRDTGGHQRKAIVFELAPIEELSSDQEIAAPEINQLDRDSLGELRAKALTDSAEARTPAERKTMRRRRSRAIKLYSRARER